jgi:hypothetical protein
MNRAFFRFYAALNDFLPPGRRQIDFSYQFTDRPSIKDMIEAIGVPHPEVDLILVNGKSVDFSYLVRPSDRISVFPAFASLDITPPTQVRPQLPGQMRFVVDNHLGKLARYLRMLGFDTLYQNDYRDQDLATLSGDEDRILLTRDRGLLKRSAVIYGYCVRSINPQQQLLEVIRRFSLLEVSEPFRRCLRCNGLLELVAKEVVVEKLPLKVKEHYREFQLCRRCEQIYWKGIHYERMQQFINMVVGQNSIGRRSFDD